MSTAVISQPMYFPWPGFFEQMALADVFIWLDDVQFSKGSYTNRIQVKLGDGRKWMSIPLEGKGTLTPILDLKPSTPTWASSHRDMLHQSLRDTPNCEAALQLFDAAVVRHPLVDVLIASAELPGQVLGVIPKDVLRSSGMNIGGQSSQRVLNIVKAVGCTRYLTGHGAADYLDHEQFEAGGITVEYMDYSLTAWPQKHGEFSPYVTILDLIAAQGDMARQTLQPRSIHWREFLARRGSPSSRRGC